MTRRNRCLVREGAVTREIPAPAGGVVIETFVPWKMVRRGVRKRIVTPLGEPEAFTGEAAEVAASQDTPLLRALGLAHHWQRLQDEERVESVDRIAELEGVDTSYIRRLLRLTLMAPKTIENLALDSHSRLEDVLGRPLPLDWRHHGEAQAS